jgi:hypothetical protein
LTLKYSLSDSPSSLCGSSSAPGSAANHEPPITDRPHSVLSLFISSHSELFCAPLHAKSLPCHSYEYMGGGGYPQRVHISLNPQHLSFSTRCSLNPCAPSHTRYRQPKPLPAITYENTGGRGSEIPILIGNRRLRPCRSGGSTPRVHISLNSQHLAFRPSGISVLQHVNSSTLQRSHYCAHENFCPLAPVGRIRMSLTRPGRSSS